MIFIYAHDSLFSEEISKIYARQSDYHVNGMEHGLILAKVIFRKSGLRKNTIVAKYKRELQALPEIMTTLTHHVDNLTNKLS